MAGAAISRRTQMLWRAKSIESADVMVGISLASDRHLHDGLVGLDDLVADGDNGIQRQFGLVDGVDDIDHVALARGLLRGRLFALLHRADGIFHGAGEEIAEARARALRGAGRGRAAEFRRRLISGNACERCNHLLGPYFLRRSTVRASIDFVASITLRSAS